MLTSCGSIPTKKNRSQSAPKYYEDSHLAKIFSSAVKENGDKSGFVLLRDGHRTLNERLYLADTAEHTIDVQYYIWNSDKSGKRLSQKLIQAADRGVSVRVILRGLNCMS
jgi:cardiolipin synthase C